MKKIFVMIPSLFDPSIQKTVEECLSKAKHPDRITFGLSLQGVDNVNFDHIKNEKRIIILDKHIVYGIGKTRYHLQQLYNNEDYILSIDCHTGFSTHWDEKLIGEHDLLNNDKGVITQFLSERFMSNCTKGQYIYSEHSPWVIEYAHADKVEFIKERNLSQRVAPHFIFATKEFAKIPYPYMYFWGDEDDILSIKLFCNGFDMYELENTYLTTVPKNAQDCEDRSNWFLSAIKKYQTEYNYTLSQGVRFEQSSSIVYDSGETDLSTHLFYPGTKKVIDKMHETRSLLKNGFSDTLMEDFREKPRSLDEYFSFHGIDKKTLDNHLDKHIERAV
jgi:hypothetical protein